MKIAGHSLGARTSLDKLTRLKRFHLRLSLVPI
jgi:hypothetical protein